MLGWLKRNAQLRRIGQDVYARIVAASRSEVFFRDWGVPDTMHGRFEMIVLHLFVVLERLKREGEPGQRLGQAVLERLFADMDDALRQIGIGDMGVPPRIRRTANAVHDRVAAYGGAVGAEALAAALLQHVYADGGEAPPPGAGHGAARLAHHVRVSLDSVGRQPFEALCADGPAFAQPADNSSPAP